ncbi:MAG TPA: hypothetical protein VHC22_09045 [Pirellulales bacterium]|nr:hypothetical protein [Pirellulales bacterium]
MLLFAQVEITTMLFLGGLVVTCGALLLRTHRQLAGRPKTPIPSPASFSQPNTQSTPAHRLDAPAEMRRWEVEMHDRARELQSQLDSKIAILQHLILDARQQADRLEADISRAEALGRADAGEGPSGAAEAEEHNRIRIDATGARAGTSASRRHAEIYSLADSGLSSAAIANRVGCPIGEIELILGLRAKA